MGQMRFFLPRMARLLDGAVEHAYLAGLDGIPWECRYRKTDHGFSVEREVAESGNLFILWPVKGFGELVLSTATLVEREQPYLLPVELARGAVNRLRNQAHEWQMAGLQWKDDFSAKLQHATSLFIRAATSQHDPLRADEVADECLRFTLQAMNELAAEFAAQALACRHEREPRLSTMLGGRLGSQPPSEGAAEKFLRAFNSAASPLRWKSIETTQGQFEWTEAEQRLQWCRSSGLRVCAGPLVQLDRTHLPDWVYLWEDDFDSLLSYVVQFIEEAVTRFRGQVHVWHSGARLNRNGALELSEENRLRLAVASIQAVRASDEQTPVLISFDQPWGEYLLKEQAELAPLHFADTLARAQLGIAGFGLELNLGYATQGALARDVLEISRQVDRWGVLGLPLMILLSSPSSSREDPLALHPARGAGEGDEPTLRTQQELAEKLIPLLAAKSIVQGLVWNQAGDAEPHEFAHGGAFDVNGTAKPILESLAQIRRQHLV